jgi:hypothetical protein
MNLDKNCRVSGSHVAETILRCLREGKQVEIEGFGTFYPGSTESFRFESIDAPLVFISYASEDAEKAERLYDRLRAEGMNPWMDRRDLLPGQNWPRMLESVIEASDFFIACLSTRSLLKRGGFQTEVRFALDIAKRLPLEDIFLIPARLEKCHVPATLNREWQYIDLFPDWDKGVNRIIGSIRRHLTRRNQQPEDLAA